MTLKTTQLRDAIRYAIAVGATIAASTGAAYAQDNAGEQQEEATTLDRIQVTGSRIMRAADVETSQPVLSLSREDIQKQGVTSVADVVQKISTSGAALNRTFNNGGDGSAGISLRNLGDARTLVLVNGRRWSTGLGGAVDLNTIPTAMVERIEVLKDGASTIYGSDAIAGVVNIITKNNFSGAEFSAYVGQYDKGDGSRESVDFTLGNTGDRGSILFGASYVKEGSVMAGDRAISAGGPPFFGGQSGTGYPGSYVRNGTRYVLINGVETRYRSAIHGYNTAPDNYLLTPQERRSLFSQGTFDITDKVSFRAEAMYNERISEQLLAAMPVTGLTLSAGSMYNPFGVDLRGVNRRYGETGGRSFNQNVKSFHFYGGLEGYFDVGDRMFNWDVGFRRDTTDSNDLTYGLFNVARLREAYGPSAMVGGQPVCLDATGAVISGCVPINPLGPLGSISPDAINYSAFTAHDSTSLVSKGITANISGEIVNLPAGPLAFAVGYEQRSERGQFEPDAFIAAGLSTGNGVAPTAGSYKLDEVFVELSVPVLADIPGAQLLDFSLATRYSDYNTFGDTLNSKFGFRWKPIEDLMLRGNYSEGFRAPTISNLYGGAGDSYETFADPCSIHTSARSNPAVAARCDAEGVPATFEQPGNGGARQTIEPATWLSNEDLMPETSKSKTLGIVYSPQWIEGLNVSLDWWNIQIENAITRPEAQFILDKCYAGTSAESAAYCGYIGRDPAYPGNPYIITRLDMPMLNLAEYDVEGYDLSARYQLPETSFGVFAFNWDSVYVSKWARKATPESTQETLQGQYLPQDPYWRIRSNLRLDWSLGDLGVSWTARYMSGLMESCPFDLGDGAEEYCSDPTFVSPSGPAPRNRIGATTYHDLQVRYATPWNATVTVGANNVFDKDPPMSLTVPFNMFDPQYDLPGQFFYLQYNQKF